MMPGRSTVLAAALFALGIALVALSILRGEGSAGLFVCVPFFSGTGLWASLGVLCFFGGMAALFVGLVRGAGGAEPQDAPEGAQGAPERPPGGENADAAPRPRAGGVILLGPIPLVFGSDPGISRTMFYVALGLMAMFLLVLLALAIL